MRVLILLPLLASLISIHAQEPAEVGGGIPIRFTLKEPGFVTLVVENGQGERVRNLISETQFPAGENQVFWDGLDDLDRDVGAASFGVYHVPGKVVPVGEYTVRGLVRPKIGLTYEIAPYTNGKPAWFTADKSSGWLTNHSAPEGMLFVPAGVAPVRDGKPTSKGGQILVGSHVSEGGSGLAWLDLDGNKLHGQEWVGGNWTAATHFALDQGDNPVPGVYAYAGTTHGSPKDDPELRLNELLVPSEWGAKPNATRLGTGEDRPVLSPHYRIEELSRAQSNVHQDTVLGGLAVRNGVLVAALKPLNQLVFIDAHQNKVIGKVELKDPRGLLFDRQGRLWALSGTQLLRFARASDPARLPVPEVVVAQHLEDPQQLAIDQQGNIYVSDWGTSHRVKVFTPTGQPLRAVGKAGAPTVGAYDPLHMNHPAGLAIDDRGRLWVAEKDFSPKRVSVWTKQGNLENALYGPARYGGGGAIDPRDKNVFYYGDERGGMQFSLDWKTGRSRVENVYYRAELDPVPLANGHYMGSAPETCLPVNGRTYLTNAYNNNPVQGAAAAEIWILENQIARKVAAMGSAWGGKQWLPMFRTEAFEKLMPADFDPKTDALFFAWSDVNGDSRMQPSEVVFQQPANPTLANQRTVSGVTVQHDLSFVVAVFGDEAVRFSVTGYTAAGVPLYAITKPEVLVKGVARPLSTGGGQALVGRNGWSILTTAPQPFSPYGFAGVHNGKPVWSYANLWPGLHSSHNAAMPSFPGELLGPTRLAGPLMAFPRNPDVGELWAVNANKGTIYVFTMDGLFVATLFQDSRTASWTVPEAVPGMAVDRLSLSEECFWPQITQMDDGKVYLQVGTNDGPIRIVHVTGLDGIRRLPGVKINITPDSLREAAEAVRLAEAQRQDNRIPRQINIPLVKDTPKVDGKIPEWRLANWAKIDSRRMQIGDWGGRDIATQCALAVSGDRLYGVLQTDTSVLLKNTGTSLQTLFKTGGGWDIMIGAAGADPQRMKPVAGDVRLLISEVRGKPVAMVYRAVVPGFSGSPVQFISQVKTVTFDGVDDVSADIELASDQVTDKQGKVESVNFEFSIPLSVLGIKPEAGQSIRGDVGVLRGDGVRTLQRVYWNNKSSGLVSDVPSEAEQIPRLWGTFRFQAPQ